MKSVIENDIIPYFKMNQYSRGIYEGTHGIITCVTKKVSWLEFYKWHILICLLIIFLSLATISCFRSGKKSWGWVLFTLIGLLFIFLWKIGGRSSDNFGGGSSSGGGASGKW
ncbi:hypothetical protein ACFLYH_00375 [Candidatus Dependentiae bacterium]